MTTFAFTELVPNKLESAALGVNAAGKLTDADLNKAVKFGTANNYVLCANGDQIDGFIKAIEPFTVNDGFGFGGVQRQGRVTAEVGTNQGATPMAVGDLVAADAQVAAGTAGAAKVRTVAGVAGRVAWRCIRIISGTGAAGSVVLLERL